MCEVAEKFLEMENVAHWYIAEHRKYIFLGWVLVECAIFFFVNIQEQ